MNRVGNHKGESNIDTNSPIACSQEDTAREHKKQMERIMEAFKLLPLGETNLECTCQLIKDHNSPGSGTVVHTYSWQDQQGERYSFSLVIGTIIFVEPKIVIPF